MRFMKLRRWLCRWLCAAVPDSRFRKTMVIKTRTECLKPGQVVAMPDGSYRVTKLLSASAREVIYEAEPV